uniref:ABC transport system permease protein n=1 Tax=Candidatus Kentrum sp. LPFa TaxID=2126335 RepID=A0A450XEU5_9GAMM|nr:MAG: hypothetical protein BECKLPF1236C_GA0070990_100536 [Candidatus Kentron sp. LPFa]
MKNSLAYVILSARQQGARVSLTVCGLALSFAAIAYAYGLAGFVDGASTRVLSVVLDDALAWIIPRGGVRVDSETGAILPVGSLSSRLIDEVKHRAAGTEWTRVKARAIEVGGLRGVLYCDERRSEREGLAVSPSNPGLRQTDAGLNILLGNDYGNVEQLLSELPLQVAIAPLRFCDNSDNGLEAETAWLLSNSASYTSSGSALEAMHGLEIRSTPVKSKNPDTLGVLVLIEARGGRFDPYSFRTKFSALVLHESFANAFGWGIRVVFAMGLLLSLSSALIGIAERKNEIAWFVVNGYLPQMTVLLFIEAILLNVSAWTGGAAMAIGLLVWRAPVGADWSFVVGNAIGMGIAFTLLALLISTLVPAQSAAARTPADVVRATI